MNAAVLWARTHWARRRRSLAVLVLLVGVAGGAVLTATAGARRTASSLDRLIGRLNSADLLVHIGALEPGLVDELADLPGVQQSGRVSIVFAIAEGVEMDLALFAPHDERAGVELESDLLLRGRLPEPSRSTEVVANETAAAALGVDVGDEIELATLTAEQVAAEVYDPPLGPRLHFEVVGITRGLSDLASVGEGGFGASSALLPTIRGDVDEFGVFLALDLDDDVDPREIEAAIDRLVPPGRDFGTLPLEVRAEPSRDAIEASASGLAVFAALAAATSLLAISQAVGRHVATGMDELSTAAAVGMTRRDRVAATAGSLLPVAVGGAAVAVVVAIVASPLMPIGLARRAEPDPGLAVDAVVLGLGAAVIAVVVIGAAAVAGVWTTRPRSTTAPQAPRASVASTAIARLGAGPIATTGVRLALDRRPPALPVRSALVGASVAVIGIVAVVTFSASLERLLDVPARWGQPWDLTLQLTADTVDDATEVAAREPAFRAVARWDAGFSFVEGEGVRAYGLDPVRGEVGFSLRSGAQPRRADEVVFGPVTAERHGVRIGDTIAVGASPDGAGARPLRVVGTALFPQIDDGNFTDAIGLYAGAFADLAVAPDLFEASQLVVRLRDQAALDAVVRRFDAQFPGSASEEGRPRAPGQVDNLSRLRPLLGWMAWFVAAVGVASVVHVLYTTSQRRRSELATLRSLGLTRVQTVGCLVCQALTIASTGVLVGVPVGLAVGRWTWGSVAERTGVVPDASWPLALVAGLGVAALMIAALVAVPSVWRAMRLVPATALRTD